MTTSGYVLSGPLVWGLAALGALVVGTSAQNTEGTQDTSITRDCWKCVVREHSTEPSCGLQLNALLADPRVISFEEGPASFVVTNEWGEQWDMKPVVVCEGEVELHASKKGCHVGAGAGSGSDDETDEEPGLPPPANAQQYRAVKALLNGTAEGPPDGECLRFVPAIGMCRATRPCTD
jgi:hypothetical protein